MEESVYIIFVFKRKVNGRSLVTKIRVDISKVPSLDPATDSNTKGILSNAK